MILLFSEDCWDSIRFDANSFSDVFVFCVGVCSVYILRSLSHAFLPTSLQELDGDPRAWHLAVQIDVLFCSWALSADFFECYQIPQSCVPSVPLILIRPSTSFPPTATIPSRHQCSIPWRNILQTMNEPLVFASILRPFASVDCSWCNVLEFADEFGLSFHFEPFVLAEPLFGYCS